MCGVNLYICKIMMEYVIICYVSLSNWTWSFSHWSRPTPDAEKKLSHHWVAGSSTGSNANISGQSPAIHSFLLCFHLLISHCIILHHDFGWLDWLEVKVYGSSPPLAGDFRVGFQDPTPPTYAFLGASSSRWPTSRKAKAAPWDRQECFHPKWWSAWWFGTMEFYDFPFSWECHHPNWRSHIFQRGSNHQPAYVWWHLVFYFHCSMLCLASSLSLVAEDGHGLGHFSEAEKHDTLG